MKQSVYPQSYDNKEPTEVKRKTSSSRKPVNTTTGGFVKEDCGNLKTPKKSLTEEKKHSFNDRRIHRLDLASVGCEYNDMV